MATKVYRDQMLKLSKEELVRQYHEKSSQLFWYERLESLRDKGIRPAMAETVNCGEFDPRDAGEWIVVSVYAPLSATGGIIRLKYGNADGSYGLFVRGFEEWLSQHRSGERPICMQGERVLAERLGVALNRLAHPATMDAKSENSKQRPRRRASIATGHDRRLDGRPRQTPVL